MKKLFAIAMALFFMTATSGLVLAQGNTGSTPAKTSGKGHKKHHTKKKRSAATTAPAPAGK
jgi:hypothetical protein